MKHYLASDGNVYAFPKDYTGELPEGATLIPDKDLDSVISKQNKSKEDIRATRNYLLRELDAVVSNPLRYSEFTEAQVTELASYRKALLDVPQQKTFPKVKWPVVPAVLK